MDKGIFATVEHRKLMELKNCGAVDAARLEDLAELLFLDMKEEIINVRKLRVKPGFWAKLFDLSMPVEQEVHLMFSKRQELVDHLADIEVPSGAEAVYVDVPFQIFRTSTAFPPETGCSFT